LDLLQTRHLAPRIGSAPLFTIRLDEEVRVAVGGGRDSFVIETANPEPASAAGIAGLLLCLIYFHRSIVSVDEVDVASLHRHAGGGL
jgi:hypothetical protein